MHPAARIACRAATPACGPRPVGREPDVLASARCNGSADRGTSGRRPHRNPRAISFELVAQPLTSPLTARPRSMSGGVCKYVIDGAGADGVLRHLERVARTSTPRAIAQPRHRLRFAADEDHVAAVVQRVRAPVPHVERVHAVVRVRRPVQVDVPGVGRVLLLELRLDRRRVGGLGAAPPRRSRCSSGGGSGGTPTAPGGTGSPTPPCAHERLVPVHVEEVAEPQAVRRGSGSSSS